MKRAVILLWLVTLTTLAVPNAPTIDQLNPEVLFNPLFSKAPSSRVHNMYYVARELPGLQKYSDYHIQLVDKQKHATQYRTEEIAKSTRRIHRVKHPSVVYGNGVGHGGIFSLKYIKNQTLHDAKQSGFHKEYEITHFDAVKGDFFPLHVGNEVRIDYRDREFFSRSGETQNDRRGHGTFLYKVVDKFQGYAPSKHQVPGDIYVIRVEQQTDQAPYFQPLFEYWYAEKLGWYIATKYYKHGEPVARYALVDWD